MKQNIEDGIKMKISVIGSPGVGKTCIVNRYITNTFIQFNNSTVGASYYKKNILFGNKEISLDIWDTAGQERFRSLGKHFYRNAQIIIMVYDITNIKTFEEIKGYWYNEIKENGEKYKIIAIVGNKIDLFDQEGISEIDENIVEEFINNISNNNNCLFIHKNVSAKSGVNITPLFDEIVKEYVNNELKNKSNKEISDNEKNIKDIQIKTKKKKKGCC